MIMRIFKFIACCIFALTFMNVNVYGDRIRKYKVRSYIPIVGDTIAFYPLNSYYKGNIIQAYSCFYNSESAEKGFKDKFRFHPNANGLTPASEISDVYMRVEQVIPSYIYKKEKYFAVNFTRIADGKQIILAIPYSMKGVPTNAIERTWLHKEYVPFFSIPFYTKSFLSYFKQMVNEEIIFYGTYKTDTELYDMLEFANKSYDVSNLNFYRGKKYTILNMGFLSTSTKLVYPNLYCTIQDAEKKIYYIPLTYFVGNAKLDYLMSAKMENLLDAHFKRSILLENKIKTLSQECEEGKLIKKFSGKEVSLSWIEFRTSMFRDYGFEIRKTTDNTPYSIRNGNYKCLGFQYKIPYIKTNRDFELYAILKDSIGEQFYFPAINFNNGIIDYNFDNIFVLKSEADAHERKMKSDANEIEAKIKFYTKKYGEKAANGIVYDGCSEERYLKLRKKYGAQKAGYMAMKQFKIGWTYEEVMEAVQDGYFELLNTYENKYSYDEYYQYRKYYPRYVLFENGKVVSIND